MKRSICLFLLIVSVVPHISSAETTVDPEQWDMGYDEGNLEAPKIEPWDMATNEVPPVDVYYHLVGIAGENGSTVANCLGYHRKIYLGSGDSALKTYCSQLHNMYNGLRPVR